MALYETLKFIHIVAATVVTGGSILITAFLASALTSRSGERMNSISTLAAWVGPRVFAPAWVLVLGFGVWTTVEGDFDFGDAWISIGFVVFAVALIAGPTLHERHAKGLRAAIAQRGPESMQTMAVARRELVVATIETALIVFAVWAMTAKPGLG